MKAWNCSLESQVCGIDEVSVLWVDFDHPRFSGGPNLQRPALSCEVGRELI